jgi:predicted phage terminase large subunit-like protein
LSPALRKRLEAEAIRRGIWKPSLSNVAIGPLSGAELPWQAWVTKSFPGAVTAPFAQRHIDLWEWFERVRLGEGQRPRIEVWPRGGGKSSSAELGCVRWCVRLARRFVLYISARQDNQANVHVGNIAAKLEAIGVERAVSVFGKTRGWNAQMCRTANGFNIVAFGLDAALRGIKLEDFRPDAIIFDDLDELHDTPSTTHKKIEIITKSILPAGSSDLVVLGVQNKVLRSGIFSQLADGTAEFLLNREAVTVHRAIEGLKTDLVTAPDGNRGYVITGGTPSWEGQNLAVCQDFINLEGYPAFREECQQEVDAVGGIFFDVSQVTLIDASEVPRGLTECRAWDWAATRGTGFTPGVDRTVGAKLGIKWLPALPGKGAQRRYDLYILDAVWGQWGEEEVRANREETIRRDGSTVMQQYVQDRGGAGKLIADEATREAKQKGGSAVPALVTGKKASRAKGLAGDVNAGNVFMVRAAWNKIMLDEFRDFREDENHEHDDFVDAAADARNRLVTVQAGHPTAGRAQPQLAQLKRTLR